MAQVLGIQDDSDDWRTLSLSPETDELAEALGAMGALLPTAPAELNDADAEVLRASLS